MGNPKKLTVTSLTSLAAALLFASTGPDAIGETFKCQNKGKVTYADTPCSARGARVDSASDKVSQVQRLQAEVVNQQNRNQLSELQYQAARSRQTPASIYILNSTNAPTGSTSLRPQRLR